MGVEEEAEMATLETNATAELVENGSQTVGGQTDENQGQVVQEDEGPNTAEESAQETVETNGDQQQAESSLAGGEETKPDCTKPKTKGKCSIEEMMALSPEPVVDLSRAEQLQAHLGALFEPDDGICVLYRTRTTDSGRKNFSFPGETYKCGELVEHAVLACKGRMLKAEIGSATRVNAVSKVGSGYKDTHKDRDVTSFDNLVIETDYPSLKRQLFYIGQIPEKIKTIVLTGGRGAHAVIEINAKNKEEYDEISHEIYAKYDCLTVDRESRNPSRPTRLAGGIRYSKSRSKDKVVQRLIYLNNNPDDKPILPSGIGKSPVVTETTNTK